MADLSSNLTVALRLKNEAQRSFNDGNIEDCYFFLNNCLKMAPHWKESFRDQFISVTGYFLEFLEKNKKYDVIFDIYKESSTLYDDSEVIEYYLGAYLQRYGFHTQAITYFKKSLQCNNNYFPAYKSLQLSLEASFERWHYRMLNDKLRNKSYKEAIIQKVNKGFIDVMDIGTGTGLFCLYAVECGAKNVYGCDMNPVMISIAEEVVTRNGLDDKIKLIGKLSNEVQIPEDIPDKNKKLDKNMNSKMNKTTFHK